VSHSVLQPNHVIAIHQHVQRETNRTVAMTGVNDSVVALHLCLDAASSGTFFPELLLLLLLLLLFVVVVVVAVVIMIVVVVIIIASSGLNGMLQHAGLSASAGMCQ
jgi:membrane-associated HD superfamily phosphohydrolase